ncbi:Transposase [Macleaya cordata]|uniref:Transposase n=1 Tax=Macleaya cordata TaxID=56857 RepID=A0A200Q595_MACCD|nr:Transposase [Macleaya cordata]
MLSKFSALWRSWKRRVAQKYILPFEDRPNVLKRVPKKISSLVDRDDWDKFVKWRLSNASKELSTIASDACTQNKYPHRLGRLGYAGLKEKLKKNEKKDQDAPISPISRAKLWQFARQNDKGEYKNEDILSTSKKIDKCSMKIADGSLTCDAEEDALTHALGPEHPGRVRAAGVGVTKTLFFNTPRRRSSIKACESIITQLQQKLKEKDMEQVLKEEDMKEMEQKLEEQKIKIEKDMEKKMKSMMEEMLSQYTSRGVISTTSTTSGKVAEQFEPCKLLDSNSNVVALGHINYSNDEEEIMIHGVRMGNDCVKVEINLAQIPKALLPRPSGDLLTVEDALKMFVAWPKELVRPITDLSHLLSHLYL